MSEKKQNFLKGTVILTVSTIVVKLVGVFFSIPLGNMLDAEYINYFNVAYDVFNIFNAIATAGLPVAVSKMVSSALVSNKRNEANKIYRVTLQAFSLFGLICSIIMFFFSEQFASFMHAPGANYSIKALAPTVFFCCIMSATRGYFQGRSNMLPTAISQIIESVVKLLVGISLAYYFAVIIGNGELASAGAITGVSVSAALGSIYLIFRKKRQDREDKKNKSETYERRATSRRKVVLSTLLKISIPITIGSCLLYILNLLSSSVINGGLASIQDQLDLKYTAYNGIWNSAAKIFDLPAAVVTAASTSIFPILTAAIVRNDKRSVRSNSSAVLRIGMLVMIPCAAGFALFGEPICRLFYFNKPVTAEGAGVLLQMSALGVIFSGIIQITNSIMQAHGKMFLPVFTTTLGGAIRLTINYFLVRIPEINIKSAPIALVSAYLIAAIINLILIYRIVPGLNILAMSLPILLATAVMGGISYLTYWGLGNIVSDKIAVIAAIVVAVIVYIVFVFVFRAVKKSDVLMLPKGEKLAKIFRM